MYCRLLERAIRALRNEPVPEEREVTISLGLDALLPKTYVPDPRHRIDLYRKLHRAVSPEDLDSLKEELSDRFGGLPPQVDNLLAEAGLRQIAQQASVISMRLHNRVVVMTAADPARLMKVLSAADLDWRQIDEDTLHLRPKGTGISGRALVSFLADAIERGLKMLPSTVTETA